MNNEQFVRSDSRRKNLPDDNSGAASQEKLSDMIGALQEKELLPREHLYVTPYVRREDEDDSLELSEKDGRHFLAQETKKELEDRFQKAIARGLEELSGLDDSRVLHIGLNGEDGDTTVGEFKKHVIDMKDRKNPFGQGRPFQSMIWKNFDSPDDLRARDQEFFEEQERDLIKTLQNQPPGSTMYFAVLEDIYDPLSFTAVKEIKVGEAIKAIQEHSPDFLADASLKIITFARDFDAQSYLKTIEEAKAVKEKLLDSIKNLDEHDKVYAEFAGETPELVDVGTLRWRIKRADKDEILPGISIPAKRSLK